MKAVSVTANRHEPCISQAPIRRQKPYQELVQGNFNEKNGYSGQRQ